MKFTEDQKAFIVQRFAMFDLPAAVMRAFKEEFGIEVAVSQVKGYNGDYISSSRKMSKKWMAIFNDTRARFMSELSKTPVADRAFRMRRLQQMHDSAFEKGNFVLAANLLEQAAKEAGGLMTNRQEIVGKVDHNHSHEFNAEENRAKLAAALADAIGSEAPATKH